MFEASRHSRERTTNTNVCWTPLTDTRNVETHRVYEVHLSYRRPARRARVRVAVFGRHRTGMFTDTAVTASRETRRRIKVCGPPRREEARGTSVPKRLIIPDVGRGFQSDAKSVKTIAPTINCLRFSFLN